MKGFRFLLLCGAVIAAGCNGGVRSPDFTPELKALTVTPSTASVAVGETVDFNVTGTYTTPPGSPTPTVTGPVDGVTWSVSDSQRASVDGNGVAKGLAVTAPSAPVRVIATKDGVSDDATLTVTPAVLRSLKVEPSTANAAVDSTETEFTVTGTFSDGRSGPVAANWSSDKPTVSDVSPKTSSSSTKASHLSVGTAHIIATVPGAGSGGSDLTASGTMVIGNAPAPTPTGELIEIRPQNPLVEVSKTVTFTAFGKYSDGSVKQYTSGVTWSSSNQTIATIVAETGVATAKAQGTTTIKATTSVNSAQTTMTVISPVCVEQFLKDDPDPTKKATAKSEATDCLMCQAATDAQAQAAIDNDDTTSAPLQVTLGLLQGEVSLTVQRTAPIAAGTPVGFLVSRPAAIPLSVELLNQVRVETLNTDGSVTSYTQDNLTSPLRLTLLGQVDTANLMEPQPLTVTTLDAAHGGKAFNGLRVILSADTVSVLSNLNINTACSKVNPPTP